MDALGTAFLTSLIPAVTVMALVAFASRVFEGVTRRKREQEYGRDRATSPGHGAHQKADQNAKAGADFRYNDNANEQGDPFGDRGSLSTGGAVKDESYYGRILGLSGPVSMDIVRSRYRALVAQYHPDKVHHLGPKIQEVAEREMKEINEAFAFFDRKWGH